MVQQRKVLFVAVGETEVQGYRFLAERMREEGYECRVVTWLPRLSGCGVDSIHAMSKDISTSQFDTSLAVQLGFPDPGMAADFDRDWHFATAAAKRRHVLRIISTGEFIFRSWGPNVIVSAVGGETTRVVFEALGRHFNCVSLYFNAIPLDERFVLLPSMSAPFVPHPGEVGYKPSGSASRVSRAAAVSRATFRSHLQDSKWDALVRLYETKIRDAGIYPRTWYERKSISGVKSAILSRIPSPANFGEADGVNVLYPMHDERDFQVAVRERHAVPQVHLLKYVASTLPPGYRLWIKPHPHHLEAHHQLLLREIRDIPNIGFLNPQTSYVDAINGCDVVFTLASTLGFEALKLGKPVVCYGSPFYGGYGITMDVRDPRLISESITKAVGSVPDQNAVHGLIARMEEYSWSGQFTPLRLEENNLLSLLDGVFDVLTRH